MNNLQLTESEVVELAKLWHVYSLLKMIDERSNRYRPPHIHLFCDGSGGIYETNHLAREHYVELTEGWNNLDEAIPILTSYLKSL